ncbi:replication initiator protein A [bacterium]|nr:replication initiator protein A [bacterium]
MATNAQHIHRPSNEKTAFGRDELNLIDFPIGILSYKQPLDAAGNQITELVFTVNSYDEALGQVVPKRLTTRTSSKHGFPTPKEEQLLIGLMLLTRVKNGFNSPRVEFRPGELYALMDWPNDSTSKRQLQVGLDRLRNVNLKYENSWSTSSGQTYEKEFSTGILDSFQLTTLRHGQSRGRVEPCWVQWSSEVFADIQSGNVKELNTRQFFALKYPLTQRMYRFLDKHLAEQQRLEMNLHDFAAHIGIAEKKHVGKIKDRLRKPLLELESIPGFIQPLPNSERYEKQSRGNWIVVFERGDGQQPRIATSGESRRSVPTANDEPIHELVREFHRQWSSTQNHRPSRTELQHADDVICEYGFETCIELLPQLVKLMRQGFTDARWFGSTRAFWPQVILKQQSQAAIKQKAAEAVQQEQIGNQSVADQKKRKQQLRELWSQLPESEHDDIRAEVKESADSTVRRYLSERKFNDPLVELACHRVLEARLASGAIAI